VTKKWYADIFSSSDPDIIFVFNERSTLYYISSINIIVLDVHRHG